MEVCNDHDCAYAGWTCPACEIEEKAQLLIDSLKELVDNLKEEISSLQQQVDSTT